MRKRRQLTSIFMLLAYLAVLATSFVPHHHHQDNLFCTQEVVDHSESHGSDMACCSETKASCSSDQQESNRCEDSRCTSRNVYISSSKIIKQARSSDDLFVQHLVIPIISHSFCDNIVASLASRQVSLYKSPPTSERIVEMLLASSVGFRAPPTPMALGLI
jgi:hypothetical protein